jgi:carbonic anhydrase/acetyltransferase-like protein (isoleucine patch superfamily)
MPIVPYRGELPTLAEDAYLAATAHVVGRVSIGARCSLWYGATVRGDTGSVEIGDDVNVQEGATVHTQTGIVTRIGNRVTLGHHALVHGATIGDDVLIGVNASVLNGATVGSGSIIAAHALVPEGKEIPPGSMVVGVPGKVVRQVSAAERGRILRTAEAYTRLGQEHRDSARDD